ncbi:MAG: SPOR domain-containing protein [Acidobacteria bacterium]|nr:SPOR domain-containing protein [Acidobacteriota bacterium]
MSRYDVMRPPRPLSARDMALLFLGGVGLCAVFFSLGFLVGYKERVALPSWEVGSPSAALPGAAQAATPLGEPKPDTKLKTGSRNTPSGPGSMPLNFNESEAKQRAETRLQTPAEGTRSASSAKPAASGTSPVRQAYAVQVAAVRFEKDAQRVVRSLKKKEYPAFIIEPQPSGRGSRFYRIQVGPYPSREEADVIKNMLAQEGFKPFVRQ